MSDFVIIGGGVIGMLTALELVPHGRVTLIERGQTGREASWAGGGILSPLYPWRYADPINRLAGWSHRHYPKMAEQLQQASGIDPEYRHCGLLVLDDGEGVKPEAIGAWADRFDMRIEALDGPALHRREAALSPAIEQAWWLPDIGQMRNPRLVKSLRGAIDQAGVEVIEEHEVTGIDTHGGRVTAVQTATGPIPAAQVIVAAGSWSSRLLEPLGVQVAVTPVKGQMILFKAIPGLVDAMILDHGRYLIPRRDGRIVTGSTLEQVGFDKTTDDDAREQLHASALRLVPALADYPIEHQWAGLRPSSPGGIPFIGPHPDIDGLYVNSGHFRNGVILGLASCRLLADLILGREPILDPAPYALQADRPNFLF
jgi:glycine oxidase